MLPSWWVSYQRPDHSDHWWVWSWISLTGLSLSLPFEIPYYMLFIPFFLLIIAFEALFLINN